MRWTADSESGGRNVAGLGNRRADLRAPEDQGVTVGERTTAVRNREGAVAAREETATLREDAAGVREEAADLRDARRRREGTGKRPPAP